MMRRIRGWWRALARHDVVEREMNDELRLHLDRATERLMARGMPPAEARAAARREFGNVANIQDESRDARGVRWIEEAMQDVRFGVRSLIKTPAFTAAAVLSLVLGIGANTAIFTILKLLSPTIIAEPATFLYISESWSKPAYDHLVANTPALSDVVAVSAEQVLLAPASPADEARRASVELVSANFFSALHAPMTIGRSLSPENTGNGRERVAVLNYRFWKRGFGGDSTILGRVVHLASGASFTVIGVAGRDFSGTRRGGADLWLPLAMRASLPAVAQRAPKHGDWFAPRDHAWLTLYGRLAERHSADEARTQIEGALRQVAAADSGAASRSSHAPIVIATAAERANTGDGRFFNAMILAGTFIVLLVACFNVASLMLARAAHRGREIAVRLCLGASRARLVRQMITESAIVALTGGVAALVLSVWTVRAVAAAGGLAFITDDDPDRLAQLLRPDAWVFALAFALSSASVLVCGLIPALHTTQPDLVSAIKADGGTLLGGKLEGARLRGTLVVAQVALSLVLLVSAGVLTRSFVRALGLDTGFDRTRVLQVSTTLRLNGYDSTRAASFARAFEQRLAELPSVRSVAHGDLPLVGARWRGTLTTEGTTSAERATEREAYVAAVTPSFFAVLGIPIVRGRAFDDAELKSHAQVVVVSEATARTLWPNDDPLGKVVKVNPSNKKARLAPETVLPSAVVIGVARDAQMVKLGQIPPAYAYVPSASGELLIGTAGDAHGLAATPTIRDAARSLDPNVLVSVETLDDRLAENGSIVEVRTVASLAGAIGALALTLATIGIFGLVAYSVAQRTRELGIRRALGASAADVVALVLRDGLLVVGLGVAIGIVAGAASTRLLSALLFGMSPLDPIAYGAVAVVMAAVTLLACYIPARRATRVDPLIALKSE